MATDPEGVAVGDASYPAVADARCASTEVSACFASFFAAKNSHEVAATMRHFSPEVVTYTDAILGWAFDGFEVIEGVFAQYMPTWPPSGLSYPTRILGDAGTALVAFTDTPELFGGELRILGAVDFRDGKIVRWVDYWDSVTFDDALYEQLRTPAPNFPTDFKEGSIGLNAAPALVEIATRLQDAFAAGDAQAASVLLSEDTVYEDMALRTQLLGRADTAAYLSRVLDTAPYGMGSRLRHVVGGATGGGFEWIAGPDRAVAGGITAVEVDSRGLASRLTCVYDSRQLSDAHRRSLALLSIPKPPPQPTDQRRTGA
jgi:ketosteroid isomerase-like protein